MADKVTVKRYYFFGHLTGFEPPFLCGRYPRTLECDSKANALSCPLTCQSQYKLHHICLDGFPCAWSHFGVWSVFFVYFTHEATFLFIFTVYWYVQGQIWVFCKNEEGIITKRISDKNLKYGQAHHDPQCLYITNIIR